MSSKKFILVGSNNTESDSRGGVDTLSRALFDYATKLGFQVNVISTSKTPFINRSIYSDINGGLRRIWRLIINLCLHKYSGVIIFSSAGLGFYEKIFLSLICRFARVPCAFFIVDGWFFSLSTRSIISRLWFGCLLKIPSLLIASGINWVNLFNMLGIKDGNLRLIHYWLDNSIIPSEACKTLSLGHSLNFIFVGWMIEEKGIREILEAIEALYFDYPFHFSFLGNGPMLNEVRRSIDIFKWEERVSAPGWVSDDSKRVAFSSSHVFILPSYAEGFPMSLIEAMSFGLPAICSDVGGIADTLHNGKNGFLVSPRSSQDLIEAMRAYLQNPELIGIHSHAALIAVNENHNANRNCKKLFDAMASLNR